MARVTAANLRGLRARAEAGRSAWCTAYVGAVRARARARVAGGRTAAIAGMCTDGVTTCVVLLPGAAQQSSTISPARGASAAGARHEALSCRMIAPSLTRWCSWSSVCLEGRSKA